MDGLERSKDNGMNIPRIRYHVVQSGRAFERLLKEHSFSELHDAIRTKLDLDSSLQLQMHRVQDGVKYDLEDEDDFAAMKSAAYASDAFDVHIAFQKRKIARPASKRSVSNPRSRRVSIVLPEKEAATIKDAIQPPSQSNGNEPVEPVAEAPPLKKTRRKSVSAVDATPAQPSILKRKSAADITEDTSDANEPPTKKHKPEKPSKVSPPSPPSQSASVPVKRKPSSDKLHKGDSPTESSESTETLKKASKSKSSDSRQKSDTDKAPSKKKSKTKHDDEPSAPTKPTSKVTKLVSSAAKPAVNADSPPPILNYAQLRNRIILEEEKSQEDQAEDLPAQRKKPKLKQPEKATNKLARVKEETNERKKTSQEGGKSKKINSTAADTKDRPKKKAVSVNEAKNKGKEKRVSVSSSSSETDSTSTTAGERPGVPGADQHKSIETLVAEIESSIKNRNSPAEANKSFMPQAGTSQASSRRTPNVPTLPFKSKVLQVVMQSNDEGSESGSESQSSDSNSGSSDGEDVVANRKSSLAEKSPSIESEFTRQGTNLEAVDLEALVRGSSAKSVVASLSRLEEEEAKEDEDNSGEGGELEEEEEEEEVNTKHSMIPEAARRLSAAKIRVEDDDSEDESNSASPPSVADSSMKAMSKEVDGKRTEKKAIDEDSAAPAPDDNSSTEATSVSSESGAQPQQALLKSISISIRPEIEPLSNTDKPFSGPVSITGTSISTSQRAATSPVVDSRPHTPTPASPKKNVPSIPVVQATPRTPGTVQRMKDKHGNRPVDNAASTSTNEDEDDVQTTVRPGLVKATKARPTPSDVEEAPSGRASLQPSSKRGPLVPVLEKRVLRSSRMPPPASPGLSVTVKEKEKSKKKSATVVPQAKTIKTAAVANVGGSEADAAVLGSQWQILQSQPTTVTSPSQIDELQSVLTDSVKSPKLLSPSRYGSRRRDETHVEHELVESMETLNGNTDQPRSPLFLPGASQLSPSQFRVDLIGLDDGPLSSLQAGAAPSEVETEPESDKDLAVPSLSQPLKSIFPSLSELSFNKFRPSFLMKSQSQSQATKTAKAGKADTDDDDDDDDDDSDSDDSSEANTGSHIPKNKRAGAGVVKKARSRGLLG